MGEIDPAALALATLKAFRRLPLIERGSMTEHAFKVASIMREKQEIFLEAYSKCGSIGDAADAAGINRHCHYRWNRDPEYRLAFKLADVQCLDSIEGKGKGLAIAGNVDLIKFFLRHGRPEIYAERLRIDALDRAGLESVLARLFAKMGRPFDPATLDAEFSVASVASDVPHGGHGGGLYQDGGDHPLGGSSPPPQEKGPISESTSPVPGPI